MDEKRIERIENNIKNLSIVVRDIAEKSKTKIMLHCDQIFTFLCGKACLIELKIRLLLDRDNLVDKNKQYKGAELKDILYKNYNQYLTEPQKGVLDLTLKIRNKLVHNELHWIFKESPSTPGLVREVKVNFGDNIAEKMLKTAEGGGNQVNKDSKLFGLYLDLPNNMPLITKIECLLDNGSKIINDIVSKAPAKSNDFHSPVFEDR